jgi:hypothetical protein
LVSKSTPIGSPHTPTFTRSWLWLKLMCMSLRESKARGRRASRERQPPATAGVGGDDLPSDRMASTQLPASGTMQDARPLSILGAHGGNLLVQARDPHLSAPGGKRPLPPGFRCCCRCHHFML